MNFDFTNYMRGIATKLKDIQHVEGDKKNCRFYKIQEIEGWASVIQSIQDLNKINILVEDNAEGRLTYGNSIHDVQVCTFFIVQKVKILDADDRERIKDDCKRIMIKILSKIYKDHLADNQKAMHLRTGLANVDFDSWQYDTFGPVFDHYYGIQVVFSVTNGLNVKFNQDDWIE
jgi:hypothetical protein